MIIKDLFSGIKAEHNMDESFNVTGIAYDSRNVEEGNIFVCIKGFASDGHKYIKNAAEKGAVCALVQKDADYEEGIIPVAICEDTRDVLGKISANFFGKPADKLKIFGVTGTNGKTTITYMINSILQTSGTPCGLIGTISYKAGNKVKESTHKTPESYEIHKMFREMVDGGDRACSMEVSSHALYMGK